MLFHKNLNSDATRGVPDRERAVRLAQGSERGTTREWPSLLEQEQDHFLEQARDGVGRRQAEGLDMWMRGTHYTGRAVCICFMGLV